MNAAACILGGLALTAGGLFVVRKKDGQPDERFDDQHDEGVRVNSRLLAYLAGFVAAYLGMLLASIGTLMVYLTPRPETIPAALYVVAGLAAAAAGGLILRSREARPSFYSFYSAYSLHLMCGRSALVLGLFLTMRGFAFIAP
ncbi:MAG: hypothetical protein Q8T11_13880 [Elusimicrobiota bacterium]|nr:hypothetical protein [Elusimicrobiota bacterium]